jgi:hypothetical protein
MPQANSTTSMPRVTSPSRRQHLAVLDPQAPQALPNGATASKEEMLAAQALVKDYAKNVQEVYLPCLTKDQEEQLAALDPADPALAEKKASVATIHAKKHNSALDELQALVDRWNGEKKAFAAKEPK